jgi:hypothetical protein
MSQLIFGPFGTIFLTFFLLGWNTKNPLSAGGLPPTPSTPLRAGSCAKYAKEWGTPLKVVPTRRMVHPGQGGAHKEFTIYQSWEVRTLYLQRLIQKLGVERVTC